jgi:hypothetical protein
MSALSPLAPISMQLSGLQSLVSSSSFPCQFCHCVEPCIMCHAHFSGLQIALLLGARYQLTALRCACNGELVDSMFGRQGRQALQSTAKAFALRSSHRHTLQRAQRRLGVRQSGPQSVFHLCHVSFELHTQHPLASGLCCTCPRCTCICCQDQSCSLRALRC